MNCTANNSKPIAQCAGTVYVGELVTGTTWTLHITNMASGRMEYAQGTGDINLVDFAFDPGCIYAISLTDGNFMPYQSEGNIGTVEVSMIYVKVDKAFQADGTLYTPSEQWIVLT